jgi:hypothetical protein
MRFISILVESVMLRRLKLLKRLQDVQLSPEAGLALIQRVETNSDSAEDQAIVIKAIRATQAAQQLAEPRRCLRSMRLSAKPSASGS